LTTAIMLSENQPMSDLHDDDDGPLPQEEDGGAPTSRVYVHTRCGGQTHVSGADFAQICDPFWPCRATYCCQCAGKAPLDEVRWTDTEEAVSEYRRRVRQQTPALVKAWHYGLGFLIGGAAGAVAGWLMGSAAFAIGGGVVGALVCHQVGIPVLNQMYGIDYRRIR
jgi:hypothetical protein